MAIVTGGDAGIRQNSFDGFLDKISSEFQRIKSGLLDNFSRLSGESAGLPPPPSKEKIFVDDGFSNVPGTSFVDSQIEGVDDIKTRRISTQEPQMTVYIKKRAFWSLRNENDTRFMDPGEKLFLRATKILFENKCSQIASYEALMKAGKLISEDAELDVARIEAIADALEVFFDEFHSSLNQDVINLLAQNDIETAQSVEDQVNEIKNDRVKLIEGLRKLSRDQRKLKQATHTNWVVDPENGLDAVSIGRGSGVIELTSITNLNTDLSLEYTQMGTIQFSFEDPYNLTKITSDNIEIALSAAFTEQQDIAIASSYGANNLTIGSVLAIGPQQILEAARQKDELLNRVRKDRVKNAFGFSGSGSPLTGTDAVELVFEINASSFARDKVVGSVATLPATFNKSNFRIILLQLPVEFQLTLEEDRLVVEIFDLLDKYVAEIERLNSNNLARNTHSDVKYARRQLRNHYLGKCIVQPMDGVHVYMRGNTYKSGEITGPLGAILNGSMFVKSFAQDNNVSDAMLEEEMRQFGLDDLGIPISLYRNMRTGSFMRNAGMHVFGGLVSTVSESYNADRGYIINVSGESNLKWLNMSRVNEAPALNQPNGILEDPLTPYDLNKSIDPGTGLLKEKPEWLDANKKLAEEGKLNSILGSNATKKINNEQDFEQDFIQVGNSTIPVGHHAPGLTYRWKEGVVAATTNVNLLTPLNGDGERSAKLRRDMGVTIVPTPFANLDAADVVSLLVTGEPHSYETFMLNSRDVGTYNYGGNSNNPESYFHSFFDIFKNTNRALGNFQPFKTVNITKEQMAKRIAIQTDLKLQSKKLNELRSELARVQDQFNSFNSTPEQIKSLLSEQDTDRRKIAIDSTASVISSIKTKIDNAVNDFTKKIQDANQAGLRIYGNDIALSFENTTSESTQEELRENDKKIRLRNELLRMRTQLKCKFNYDTNLFIVSDDYDKDLDIQAFIIESLTNEIPLWNFTQFKHPYDICINVAKTLDFEFFADTQGHINFRPPKYNKVPLSLILRMFLLDKTQNKKLYPAFLEQMFKNRSATYQDEADRLEIEIRIQNILLNKPFITSNEAANSTAANEDPNSLVVVSDIIGTDLEPPSESFLKQRANLLIKLKNDLSAKIGGTPISENDEQAVKDASKEIFELNNPSTPNVNSRRLNITNKLAQLESRKQMVTSILSKIKSQVDKYETSVDGVPLKGERLTPQQMREILTPFADLIEDDFNDFLGPGSSKRFTIYDEQIINSTFTESDNNVVCRVDINGQQPLTGDQPGSIAGVPIIWAGATDFDLWRQYGWRSEGAYSKPFFVDAELQCAPYALMLLTRARRDAVRGQITVYGNEFYQLGDVVYINSRDMLYYVTGVKHSFSYEGGSFTTTLDLRYGHPLGEYIPTPLDVIGKNLIKTQRGFNTRTTVRKTASPSIGVSLGVIIFNSSRSEDNEVATDAVFSEMLSGEMGQYNLSELKNMFLKAKSHIVDGNEFPKLDIRGFVLDDVDDAELVKARQEAVSVWFQAPSDINGPLSEKEFPGFASSAIKTWNDELDPINISSTQEENIKLGRVPREEVFNVLTTKDFTNIIEVVLVFR